MRDLKRNYEIPHSLFYPPPGSKWNITGKKKKEHSLNRDDFESDILPLSFNKSNPSES